MLVLQMVFLDVVVDGILERSVFLRRKLKDLIVVSTVTQEPKLILLLLEEVGWLVQQNSGWAFFLIIQQLMFWAVQPVELNLKLLLLDV